MGRVVKEIGENGGVIIVGRVGDLANHYKNNCRECKSNNNRVMPIMDVKGGEGVVNNFFRCDKGAGSCLEDNRK